jgi:hypothetical protein
LQQKQQQHTIQMIATTTAAPTSTITNTPPVNQSAPPTPSNNSPTSSRLFSSVMVVVGIAEVVDKTEAGGEPITVSSGSVTITLSRTMPERREPFNVAVISNVPASTFSVWTQFTVQKPVSGVNFREECH